MGRAPRRGIRRKPLAVTFMMNFGLLKSWLPRLLYDTLEGEGVDRTLGKGWSVAAQPTAFGPHGPRQSPP